jgi:hypothetical protein
VKERNLAAAKASERDLLAAYRRPDAQKQAPVLAAAE